MKTGLKTRGFTIVEIIIVMTVTAILLVSALTLFSGKQSAVQFNQAANDLQSQVNQIISNVQTGYYNRPANFTCTKSGSMPAIASGGSQDLGTNADCIFLGRAIQFFVSGTNDNGFDVYNLLGLHYDPGTSNAVSTLANASPIALAPGTVTNGGFPTDFTETDNLLYGLQAVSMQYNGSAATKSGIVAIVSNINGNPAAGGSSTASLYVVNNGNTNTDQTAAQAAEEIDKPNAANFTAVDSVTVCFDGGTSLYAILTIGSNNRQLTTTLNMLNKNPTPAVCT